MEGWIKLHRKLLDDSLWLSERFTRGQAWVDLLLLANHENSFFYVRGNKVNIQRGQVGWSELKLSIRWNWSRTKLRKFLNDLEKEQQIVQHKNTVSQIITIVNYEEYQKKEQQTGQQKDSRKTAERQQKDTNKNDKNDKNDIKNKYTVIFDEFRKIYPGSKRGLETEFANFTKKHTDWENILPLLLPAIEKEKKYHDDAKKNGAFCPEFANMSTWINQRRWETEFETSKQVNNETNTSKRRDASYFL